MAINVKCHSSQPAVNRFYVAPALANKKTDHKVGQEVVILADPVTGRCFRQFVINAGEKQKYPLNPLQENPDFVVTVFLKRAGRATVEGIGAVEISKVM